MYIQPNSQIKLLKNVPLDTTYNHTILFSNASAQTSYFISCAKYSLDQQSYQRVNKGSMRVQVNAENLYDCNYLMFQNTAFGQKWFYAFITGVEYVNNETSEVTFTIDPMQTYLFDVELRQCYVEREHSSTDVAGDNVIDEPINIGDSVCADIQYVDDMTEYVVIVWHAGFNTNDEVGGVYSNMFCGLDAEICLLPDGATSASNIKTLLKNFTDNNRVDAIVSVVAMPRKFFTTTPQPVQDIKDVAIPSALINGYVPRNKKLLTYPYNYMVVDCGNDSGIYRYEWFKNHATTRWRMVGYASPNPQIALIPINYNGTNSESGQPNVCEELIMEGFPQLAYNIDGYRAYLAQSSIGSALKGAEDVLQSTSERQFNGTPTGYDRFMGKAPTRQNVPVISGLLNFFDNMLTSNTGSDAIDTFTKSVHSAKHPNSSKGTQTAGVDTAIRYKNFYFKQMTVSESYARVIDNFFDMYGYATRRIKIPNRSVRPHWNYVKTSGCVVMGNAPADDVKTICQIYDKGITFWKTPSEVGNYSLNNSL